MKNKKFTADEQIERLCSACDTETTHTVVTVTKQGLISKLTCNVCETVSTYSRDVKTSVKMSGKAANPYDRTVKYRKGQSMLHQVFGQGEVMEVIESQKIDVLFGDRVRRLIHAQN